MEFGVHVLGMKLDGFVGFCCFFFRSIGADGAQELFLFCIGERIFRLMFVLFVFIIIQRT